MFCVTKYIKIWIVVRPGAGVVVTSPGAVTVSSSVSPTGGLPEGVLAPLGSLDGLTAMLFSLPPSENIQMKVNQYSPPIYRKLRLSDREHV